MGSLSLFRENEPSGRKCLRPRLDVRFCPEGQALALSTGEIVMASRGRAFVSSLVP